MFDSSPAVAQPTLLRMKLDQAQSCTTLKLGRGMEIVGLCRSGEGLRTRGRGRFKSVARVTSRNAGGVGWPVETGEETGALFRRRCPERREESKAGRCE